MLISGASKQVSDDCLIFKLVSSFWNEIVAPSSLFYTVFILCKVSNRSHLEKNKFIKLQAIIKGFKQGSACKIFSISQILHLAQNVKKNLTILQSYGRVKIKILQFYNLTVV